MITVEGIILVLSCQKYKDSRLKEFKLPKVRYGNSDTNGPQGAWPVVYVVGDLFLDAEYVLEGDMLTVRCEDSYIHLLKKLVLSLKYLSQLYDIKQGVLRCGDDLIFNEQALETFLSGPKYDFYGQSDYKRNNYYADKNQLKVLKQDLFMVKYYLTHQSDFENPQHNLRGVNMSDFVLRPHVWGPHGIIYYISKSACECLMNEMESIQYNIFHKDEFTESYPYTIEDCGVTYILYKHDFTYTDGQFFFDKPGAIVSHTNKYREYDNATVSIQKTSGEFIIGSEGMGSWGKRIINYLIDKVKPGITIRYKNTIDCDLVVRSHFLRDEPVWNNTLKPYILWSGEAYSVPAPLSNQVSHSLSLLTTIENSKDSLYVPYVLDSPYLHKARIMDGANPRPYLITYCSSNPVYLREKLFNTFVRKAGQSKCRALGKCFGGIFPGTHQKLEGTWQASALIDKYTESTFVFALENKKVEGYITEKIMNAFHAGAIPIYWGSPTIGELFNPKAFIDLSHFDSLEECVNFVCNMSEEAIHEMREQPIYNDSNELIHLLDDEFNTKYQNKTLIRYLEKIRRLFPLQ
jgi:hypothetical protein